MNKHDLMKLWGDRCKNLSSQFHKVDDNEIELTLKDLSQTTSEDFLILLENNNEYFFNIIIDDRNYFITLTQSEYEIMQFEVEKWFNRKEKDDYKTFYNRWIDNNE